MKTSKTKKIFLGLIAISLISTFYIFYIYQKNKARPNTNILPPVTSIKSSDPIKQNTPLSTINIDPDIEFPNIPLQLPVYSGQSSKQDLNTLVAALAKKFKLTQSDNKSLWFSADKSSYLSISIDPPNITYEVNSSQSPPSNNNPSLEKAQSTSQNFVNSIPAFKDLTSVTSEIKFINTATGEPVVSTKDSANLIAIPYSPILENYPLIFSDSADHPLIIFIGANNQITKIIINPRPITVDSTPLNKYNTLNKDQVAEKLTNHQVQMIQGPSDYIVTNNLTSFPPITITNVSLEYRYDSTTQKISPYYKLTGHTNPAVNTPVIMLMPAIQ